MTAELKPLEGDKECACGHHRWLHINLLWGRSDHSGCCSAVRCLCENFILAAETDVGDAATG